MVSLRDETVESLRDLMRPEESFDDVISRLIREWNARGESIKLLGGLAEKAISKVAEA